MSETERPELTEEEVQQVIQIVLATVHQNPESLASNTTPNNALRDHLSPPR